MINNNFLKNIQIEVNPYYEKWGKGRPTKEMKEMRNKSNKWVREKIKTSNGFLSALITDSHITINDGKIILKHRFVAE